MIIVMEFYNVIVGKIKYAQTLYLTSAPPGSPDSRSVSPFLIFSDQVKISDGAEI